MQFIIFSLVILLSSGLYAQSTESLLSEGIQHFSDKNWAEAEASFKQALVQSPTDPNLLSNLALVHIERAEDAMAYALWRKALYYHPFFSPAQQGIDYLQKNGKIQSTESSRAANFLHNLYRSPPVYTYIILWIFIFLCLQSLHSYFMFKKRAADEEDSPPTFPVKLVIYLALLGLALTFATQQFLDRKTTRGLSLGSATTKLGPSEDSPTLFTISTGDQVDILNTKDSWLQIRNGENQRAWIEKDKIFIF
jgi:hypothetical protein